MTRTGPEHCADAPGLSEGAVAKAMPNCDTQLLRTRKHRAQSSKWLRGLVLTAAKAIT